MRRGRGLTRLSENVGIPSNWNGGERSSLQMSSLWFEPEDSVEECDLNRVIHLIITTQAWLHRFWSKSHGWAPPETAEYLSTVRLDRQVALSESLFNRIAALAEPVDEGELIIAWVNLGALVEGTLALFIGVWLDAYRIDSNAIFKKRAVVDPDSLHLDELRKFVVTTGRLAEDKQVLESNPTWFKDEAWEMNQFVKLVRDRRNAIHAFKDREIGTADEFHRALRDFYHFMRHMLSDLEYPENC